jgi:hypothetical protein
MKPCDEASIQQIMALLAPISIEGAVVSRTAKQA